MKILLALLTLTLALIAQPGNPAALPPVPHSPVPESVRIGLALSGGAALGFAHIGVLKVLERENIPVIAISGNSAGSLIGGTYAAGHSPAQLESIATTRDWNELFSSSVPFGARYLPERQQSQRYAFQLRHRNFFPSLPGGLVTLQNVEFLLMDMLAETEYNTWFDFDRLPIPFRAVAVDLVTGRKLDMKDGRLAQAIRASIAIPGVFSPERLGDMKLVDGGVQQYLPVEPLLEFEPDFIIAVLTMKNNEETGISLVDVTSRSMDIIGVEDLDRQLALADVLIRPDVDPFRHSDFARAWELIAAGEDAAEAALPEIRRKLRGRVPVRLRNPVPSRPLSVVRSVRFEGLETTRESTLRPLMQTRSGHYLLLPRLREDLVRVFHTGLFEDVNYRLDFAGPDSVDVTVELLERAYGFYSLGVRFDTEDNVGLGLAAGQGNLGGSGASVRAALHLGDPNEFRLGLTGTRLFRLPFGYHVDGFWGTIERSYITDGLWRADYTIRYRGGIAEAGYIIGRNAFFDVGFRVYQAGYRFPELTDLDTLPRSEWVSGPAFRFDFNSFDDLDVPTRGLSYEVELVAADPLFGADRSFIRASAASELFNPVSPRLLLRPGWEFGFSLGEPAWSEQFFSGAPDLPGFAHESFTSPHKLVGKFGVDYLLTRLFHQEDYPLYLQAFANLSTFRPLDAVLLAADFAGTFDWSTGIGLRTRTPVGPVQFYFGVADFLKPEPDAGLRYNTWISVGRDFRYMR